LAEATDEHRRLFADERFAMPLTHNISPRSEEMRRRIAVCRQRLRRKRTTQRIALRSAAPIIIGGSATEGRELFDSSARAARGEETEREH
jgi:hypothetical protein